VSTPSARPADETVAVSVRVRAHRRGPQIRQVLPRLPDTDLSPEPLPSSRWPNPRTAVALLTALGRAAGRRSSDPGRSGQDGSGHGDCDPLIRAQDAIFSFYLPLAHRIAIDDPGAAGDRHELAELGLAKAILGWTRPDEGLFEEYARQAIRAELYTGTPAGAQGNPLLTRVRARTGGVPRAGLHRPATVAHLTRRHPGMG
jgi:hypothetical protein